MDCNVLRIPVGNDFTTRMTIRAITPAGTEIEDFTLAAATNLSVVYTRGDVTTSIDEYTIDGNDIIIQWSGLQLGGYGFVISGEYEGEAWQMAVRLLFRIVATNAEANIPAGYLVDGEYVLNEWLRLLSIGSVVDGTTYYPTVSADGVISWTNDGGKENPTPVNIRGPQGYTFTPAVSTDGDLSWTNNGGLENPATVNIRGPQGEQGPEGVSGGFLFPTMDFDPEDGILTVTGVESEVSRISYDEDTAELVIAMYH